MFFKEKGSYNVYQRLFPRHKLQIIILIPFYSRIRHMPQNDTPPIFHFIIVYLRCLLQKDNFTSTGRRANRNIITSLLSFLFARIQIRKK